ncbi:MAG: zinc ribbon domain-containing protein [Elusimicrobia bacterium]|nr:zinc ribbon domain-containing protein [Candidatus Obscuribacterium magneticum]
MRFLLIWFLLSLMVSVIANAKGRSALIFLTLSMLLSPLVGLFALFFLSPKGGTRQDKNMKFGAFKKCPSCDEPVKLEDTVCRFCGKPLPEIIEVEPIIEDN